MAFTKDSTRDWMPVKVIGDDPDGDEEDEYDMNYLVKLYHILNLK